MAEPYPEEPSLLEHSNFTCVEPPFGGITQYNQGIESLKLLPTLKLKCVREVRLETKA